MLFDKTGYNLNMVISSLAELNMFIFHLFYAPNSEQVEGAYWFDPVGQLSVNYFADVIF